MKLKIKSPIQAEVFYDTDSLGIALFDSVALSNIEEDLNKVIRNPILVIEVNSKQHLYFRKSSLYQIAKVIMREDYWYVESFIFDASLEIAQQKFKEGSVIYKLEK